MTELTLLQKTGLRVAYVALTALKEARDEARDEAAGDAADTTIREFLRGGFLVVHDGGALYHEVQTLCEDMCTTKLTSHDTSFGPNLRCPLGTSKGAVLIGKTKACFKGGINKQHHQYPLASCSWLQLERSSMEGIVASVDHGFDYAQHMFSGENIGPSGSSSHTEKKERLHYRQKFKNVTQVELPVSAKSFAELVCSVFPRSSSSSSSSSLPPCEAVMASEALQKKRHALLTLLLGVGGLGALAAVAAHRLKPRRPVPRPQP
jgi:hypothetical protein